jgi:SAM-dependent methyltransferase
MSSPVMTASSLREHGDAAARLRRQRSPTGLDHPPGAGHRGRIPLQRDAYPGTSRRARRAVGESPRLPRREGRRIQNAFCPTNFYQGGDMSLLSLAKPLLKRVLPIRTRQWLHEVNIKRSDGKLQALGRAELFDAVYRERMWGGTPDQASGWGSHGEHSSEYVDFVRDFIARNNIQSILDIGCGDFQIGSRICGSVSRYIGVDVSRFIIDRNTTVFGDLGNVRFMALDVCADRLPQVDLITIREVLQHLSNADIALALNNIEQSLARFALVTEHLPAPRVLRAPNLDKPRGPNIRNPYGSGVFIQLAPFNRPAQAVLTVKHPSYAGAPSHLVTTLWKLNCQAHA